MEGSAPEMSTQTPGQDSSATSSTPFAEERPEKPAPPITPPPPPPAPEPSPEPTDPATGEPGQPIGPGPDAGDFAAVLEQNGITLSEGAEPEATATEACGRFDQGEQMIDVSNWLGERAGLDPEQQGFFLGAAVGTYCPQNFPKLG